MLSYFPLSFEKLLDPLKKVIQKKYVHEERVKHINEVPTQQNFRKIYLL